MKNLKKENEPELAKPLKANDCIKIIDKNSELIFKLECSLRAFYANDRIINYISISDFNLITIIDLLLENNEAIKKLTLHGFGYQIAHIMRNTAEILTRIVAKCIYYERGNSTPSIREKIDISSDKEIEKALNLKKWNRNNFIYQTMQQTFKNFPHLEGFANQFGDVYKKLSSFSHPEAQIKSLTSRYIKEKNEDNEKDNELTMLLARTVYKREKITEYDPHNYLFLSKCNILTIYFIVKLFKNIIKDEKRNEMFDIISSDLNETLEAFYTTIDGKKPKITK